MSWSQFVLTMHFLHTSRLNNRGWTVPRFILLPCPLLQGSIASEEAKQLQTEINEIKVSTDQYRSDLVYSVLACFNIQRGFVFKFYNQHTVT
jgi:hypothetical protein